MSLLPQRLAVGATLFCAACGASGVAHTTSSWLAASPPLGATPGAPRVSFVAEGAAVQVQFPNYQNKLQQSLDANVSVFVNFDARYRASGLELARGRLVGIPALAGYAAYRVTAEYAPNIVSNIASYGQNIALSYKVDGAQPWTVFVLRGGTLQPVAQFRSQAAGVAAPDVVANGEIPLRAAVDLQTDQLAGGSVEKATFVVAPMADQDAIESAFLPANYHVVRSQVGAPPLDTTLEEQFAPGSQALEYASPPRIVPFVNPDGTFTVGWDSGGAVHVSLLTGDGRLVGDATLPAELPRYGGFTKDPAGNLYVFTVKTNVDGDFSSNMRLTKYGPSLNRLGACDLPAGKGDGLDVMNPIDDATSQLVFYDGKVAIHLGKLMHKGPDGLNHQSGILAVVDAGTMQYDAASSMKQVAAHSFDQRMIVDEGGTVLADLADNLPRGIVITKHKVGRVAFTYKTHLAQESTKRGDKTLDALKWSNDNSCYTELGGLAAGPDGYVLLGSSERSLDNAKAKTSLNEPRNLFVVLAARDFDKQAPSTYEGSVQGEIVSEKVVVSTGEGSPIEHFFDFYGGLHYQRNVGVTWLTQYHDLNTENAIRPKLVKVSGDSFVALWEKWNRTRYVSTYYLVLDSHGRVTKPAVELGTVHLPRASDPVSVGGKVFWFGGEKGRQRLLVNVLDP